MKDLKSLKIFILADDQWHGSQLEQHASLNPDYEVKRFDNADNFFQQLTEQPDVVALDCPLQGLDGVEVMRRIKSQYPRTQVIVLGGREDGSPGAQLLKQGAFDFILKDDQMQDRLWNTLVHLQEVITLRKEVERLKEHDAPAEASQQVNGNAMANGLSHIFSREISLREYECQIIQHYLEKYNKDVLLVAKKLDIGKSTIYRMIQNGELKTA